MVFMIPSIHHKNIHKTGRKSFMAYQPKSYRKFVATTATAAMVASAVAPVVSAAAGFTDVASQYKDAVDFLVSAGVKGKSETKFGVYDEITRLDAAVILAKVLKLDVDNAKDAGFTDVPKDRAKYVNALVDAGVLNGKAAGKFGAYDKLTRAEMAKIIANAYKLKGDDVTLPFTDVNDTWAPYVKALYKNGITKGKSETKFGANDNITRGDFAVFVYRAANVDVAPQVVSVSAINAAELVVTFNKAIDKDTVIDPANGTLVDGVFTITRIDTAADFGTTDSLKASLSADGKTLTILAAPGKKFDGKYAFTVAKEAIKSVDQKALPAFSSVIEVKDTTRPVIKGVTYKDAATAVVEFSEPVDLTNLSVTAKRADDVALNGSTVLNETKFSVDTNDPRKVVVDLSAINTADLDKDIVLTLVGISDYNGNLVSPNPTSITVKYDTSDKTKASVTSVARVASDKLQIKFDRALAVKPTVKVGTTTIPSSNVAIDDNDKSVVNVTLNAADFGGTLPTGLQNVEVSGYKGVNLVTGDTVVKVVNFDVENTAPTVVSTKVEKIDGVEYLVVTYNEDVTIPTYTTEQITGTKVVNYVTSAITPIALKNVATTNPNEAQVTLYGVPASATKSKSIKINLSNIPSADYTVTLPAGLVKDVFGNASEAKSGVTFTRTSNDVKPAVATVVPGSTNDEILVNFTTEVDPVSALQKSNYTVEGAQIEKVELLSNTTTAQVKLTLAKNSNSFTGSHVVTISGVKSKTNTVMDSTTKVVSLTENVRPTITKAELISNNTIKITFSENVKAATVDDATDSTDDFVVKIGGVAYSGTLADTMSADGKEATIVLGTTLSPEQYAQTITLEKSSGFDIEDMNGNKMESFPAITVVK
jgi:hypothetical protein